MIEGAMEKPIDEIRYPNVAKQTRRLIAILASVFSLLGIINIVAVCRAAKKDVRCCHCNSPIPLDSLKWHLIVSGLLPVCNKCRAIVGAEFINPLPANPANHVNPVTGTPTERSSP